MQWFITFFIISNKLLSKYFYDMLNVAVIQFNNIKNIRKTIKLIQKYYNQ